VLDGHQPEPVQDLATVVAADRAARAAARHRLG
jgi:hypothetical protein